MDTLQYIKERFNLEFDRNTRLPIEIPNIGRVGMAELFREMGFTIGAEVGVEQGVYSEELCRANPDLKLYAVDAWKAYKGYRDHTTQQKLEAFYESAKNRLEGYNCELVRKFSMDAVKDFKDRSLDFVYIDANHDFQNCTNDIAEWSKKVKIGGIISGHDYASQRKPTNMHVAEVVNGYTKAYDIKPWFVLGTKAIVRGIIRDESRSWMWVNQEHPPRGKHRD